MGKALDIGMQAIPFPIDMPIEDAMVEVGSQQIAYGIAAQRQYIPEFEKDRHFGVVAKYVIAWRATCSALLSESGFFSIAHILESISEIDSSLLLASNHFYKQSLQVLRSFIEHSVIQIYFSDNLKAFQQWRIDEYRLPPLRGKRGILNQLVQMGAITTGLAEEASGLYNTLSGAIHSAESQLNYQGIFDGRETSITFDYDRFEYWSQYFSKCVNLGIQLLYFGLKVWSSNRPQDQVYCAICHNTEDFEVEEYEFGGQAFLNVKCQQCGSLMKISRDAIGRMFSFED